MSGDTPTPGPLDALDGDGGTVSKVDLLLGYVRGLVMSNKMVLVRLERGDRQLEEHGRDIAELQRKLGRKTRPEPSWWVRAAAIAGITTLANLALIWVLKGGAAALVSAAGSTP